MEFTSSVASSSWADRDATRRMRILLGFVFSRSAAQALDGRIDLRMLISDRAAAERIRDNGQPQRRPVCRIAYARRGRRQQVHRGNFEVVDVGRRACGT